MAEALAITRELWREKTRHGYASRLQDGRRAILMLDKATGATILQTVTIDKAGLPAGAV